MFCWSWLYEKDPESPLRWTVSKKLFNHKVAEFTMTRWNACRFVDLMLNAFGPQNCCVCEISHWNSKIWYDIYIPYQDFKDVEELNIFNPYFINKWLKKNI